MKKKISKNKNFQSRIVVGDTIKILKKIPNKFKFDVVIADPPYNIGKDFGNNNDKMILKNLQIGASVGLTSVFVCWLMMV